jgi:DNA-binding PadR family transcriptional regulator
MVHGKAMGVAGMRSSLISRGFMGKGPRQFMIKAMLLVKISRERTYSYKLMKELLVLAKARHLETDMLGLKNEVYNSIASLEKAGFIRSSTDFSWGKTRKYYSLTPKGRSALRMMRTTIRNAVRGMSQILK